MRIKLYFVIVLSLFIGKFSFATADDDAERNYHPWYASLATGDIRAFKAKNAAPYPWPVALLSIGHTMASYQNYGSDPYFHHGVDIRVDAGSTVTASVGGKIINIDNYMSGDVYWEIAIQDDDGFIWQYHHVDHNSIPDEVQQAFKSQTPIKAGTKLGEVVYWPEVSFGERYNHIHVNVLGKNQEFLNLFAFLVPLDDKKGPVITKISLLQNGNLVEGSQISGDYSVAAEESDLILHDKFIVPPYVTSYRLDGGETVTVWKFDTLPGGSSDTQYLNDFFVPSATCGDYECRKITVNLGFKKEGGQVFPTAPGKHRIDLEVADYAGNKASQSFEWTVGSKK